MNPSAMNDAFLTKLASPADVARMNELGGNYIRDRLREVSFLDKLIPPQYVTRQDCQVSTQTDTLVKIVEIEPKSKAVTMGFRGEPRTRVLTGQRVETAFMTIASEIYQKTEQELLAYTMPITKIVEENMVKDMQEIRDREFLLHAEAAVQALQTSANGGTSKALNATAIAGSAVVEFAVRKGALARVASTDDQTVRPIQRADFVEGYKMLDGNRLRTETSLITEVDFDDTLQWTLEDNGDKLQSEVQVDGWKYNNFMGRRYVRTIKTDILRPGNLYFFTAPNFLGRNFILNNVKFYIDKVANLISFQAWMDVAPMIANIASIRKVELYSGDANPTTNADSLLANFIPKAEDDLGAQNNLVDQGLRFPQVTSASY
jgi:hypothetical protein